MGALATLTGSDNYFEDFRVGDAFRHARGKTITPLENVMITNMVMNTAQGHFNEHMMLATPLKGVLSYGGVNFSMVLGLATQDCCENALEELGLDNIKLTGPVTHGDTLYAYSEVLEVSGDNRPDAGIVRFRHHGYNQRDELVVVLDRIALIKRRSHWADK
jgi:itaconyl-CoA hydratase